MSTPRPSRPREPAGSLDDLLAASGHGDHLAFADLYDAVAPRVHGLAQRVLRDRHQAEEVAQEVLLEVWQTAGRFDAARGSALAWVMTLTHRRAVDRVRTSDAARRRDGAHVAREVHTPYDETEVAAHASLEAQRVRQALAALSPIQRQAVELAYFGGHTHTEVSALLQLPLGTVKSRIRDGLTRLRVLLAVAVVEPA